MPTAHPRLLEIALRDSVMDVLVLKYAVEMEKIDSGVNE